MKKQLLNNIKFENKKSFIYVEHSNIEQYKKSITINHKEGNLPIPVGTIACLMLGPGTSISHQAIINTTNNGCIILWVGEYGVKFYSAGYNPYKKSKNLYKQIEHFCDKKKKNRIAKKLFQMRFKENIPDNYNISQIRGMEGNRVRSIYKQLSEEYNIEWTGRKYNRNNWNSTNRINKAITIANSCLYAICTAAIITLGYSTEIGFIHSGFSIAFTCDIADLYKTQEFLPIAFKIVSENNSNLERNIRYECRNHIKKSRLMKRIIVDIQRLFS